ncbi:MAG: chemotaxis protein CheA, partial [Gemmatimonadales bacterium]
VECLPLAERIGDAFLELERCWRGGESGEDLLPAVKGNLHTVKGNSAMIGLAPAQEVAHALEDACARLTRDADARGDHAAALLIEGSGLLAELVRTASAGGGEQPAAGFVGQVKEFLARTSDSEAPSPDRRKTERRATERRGPADASGNVVRVDFRRLDDLLDVLGEGMIEHSAVAETYRRVARRAGQMEELGELDRAILALAKTMKRLEAVVMGTRLLPISTVFSRFSRMVRDLAHAEGKQARLITSGGDTRLDKAILDRLGEPLLHLVTNAVVHGIERPDQRLGAGKLSEAVVELQAVSQSGRVVIRLTDDGRGLDDEKLLAKAEAMGLDPRSAGSDQLHSMIFLPGFSTADEVSRVAGRGVGLDVVATAIRALGGTIEVASRPGRGVTFTLDLPLTLAIVRSLIVEVDQERYAVPISHVAETVRAAPDAIHEINQRGVALWRGDLIHVTDGGALLGTSRPVRAPRRYYIVICSGGKRRGVLVDRLVGHQDVVVKGLDPTLGRPEVVSGTT